MKIYVVKKHTKTRRYLKILPATLNDSEKSNETKIQIIYWLLRTGENVTKHIKISAIKSKSLIFFL